ncbi:MAG: Rab family GTPase [Campylobacterota bacterium]|nr:Rab family GTPase [Campylobacterota bacterium]
MKKYVKKILLIGNTGVGKTSLVTRYVENKFSDTYLTTIGVNIMKKMVLLEKDGESVDVALMIWDVEGSTDSQKIPSHYSKGANGYIIVIDGSQKETLNNLKVHLEYTDGTPFVLAVNKCDLPSVVSLDTEAFKEKFPNCIAVMETSAKINSNVEELFKTLTNKII